MSKTALGRLMAASARSGADLVDQAAKELGTGARVVVIDRIAGVVLFSSELAAQDGRGYMAGTLSENAKEVHVAGNVLLVRAPDAAEDLVMEVIGGTAAQLLTRARRIDQYMAGEMRLHSDIVQGLLVGNLKSIRRVTLQVSAIAQPSAWGTVVRLSVPRGRLEVVYRALWQALLPAGARRYGRIMIADVGAELAVIILHQGDNLEQRVLAYLHRAATVYQLTGGIADPAPVYLLCAAWQEAAQARLRASKARRLAPAATWGPHTLLRVVPAEHLAAWAAAGLHRLTEEQRMLAGLLLRFTIKQTVKVLELEDRYKLRRPRERLRQQLGADLSHPRVAASLMLALYTPPLPGGQAEVAPTEPVDFFHDLPVWLLDVAAARQWADTILGPLTKSQLWLLKTWTDHQGRTAAAAGEFGRARATVTDAVVALEEELGVDLSLPQARADLALALHTQATTGPDGQLPDGAPGRDDWLTRAGYRR